MERDVKVAQEEWERKLKKKYDEDDGAKIKKMENEDF